VARRLPLAEARLGAQLLWSIPLLRAGRIGPEPARATLRRRLERRAADFLALVRRTVYQQPR